MPSYEVIVGNIGSVYQGTNKSQAVQTWRAYVADSKTGLGRSGNEDVCLFEDGEPIREYIVDKKEG